MATVLSSSFVSFFSKRSENRRYVLRKRTNEWTNRDAGELEYEGTRRRNRNTETEREVAAGERGKKTGKKNKEREQVKREIQKERGERIESDIPRDLSSFIFLW